MRWFDLLVIGVSLPLVGTATSCILGFDGLTGGCTGACGDGGEPDAGCRGTRGAKEVRLELDGGAWFCIDSTEVTNAHYKEFLDAKGGDTSGQSKACAENTSFAPSDGGAPGADDEPLVGVDWCDAVAFCAWAGKRLCGKIGGGSGSSSTVNAAGESMWYFACSHGGARTYPYGATYDDAACGTGALTPAGSRAACAGGFDGIFDMSGSVEEWVDECDQTDCYARGGSFAEQDTNKLKCASVPEQLEANTDRAGWVGFRCCSP
jgi:formylglycine-generating enzyme